MIQLPSYDEVPSLEGVGVDAFCALLRNNDPSVAWIARFYNEHLRIGEALRDNTVVNTLSFNLQDMFADLRSSEIDRNHPLLSFVRRSSVLRRVLFINANGQVQPADREITGRLTSHFLNAMTKASKQSKINELWINRWEEAEQHGHPFSRLMASTTSIARLTMGLPMSSNSPSSASFQEALSRNTSLEYLCFGCIDGAGAYSVPGGTSGPDIRGMLEALHQHPRLRELVVRCPGDAYDIVHGLKVPLGKIALHHLELEYLRMDETDMFNLVKWLQSCTTLETLKFNDLPMDRDTSAAFVLGFLSSTSTTTSLSKLRYSGHTDCLIESLQTIPTTIENPNPIQSIGSNLRVLEFGDTTQDRDVARFLDSLADNAALIRLESLQLYCFEADEIDKALFKSIPRWVHVRELKFEKIWSDRSRRPKRLIRAFRKNGSLHNVLFTFPGEPEDAPFSFRMIRCLTAYCDRNMYLPKLLVGDCEKNAIQLPKLLVGDCDINISLSKLLGDETVAKKEDDSLTKKDAPNHSLVPFFFSSALPAKRTAPNIMFIGLNASPGHFGPNDDMEE